MACMLRHAQPQCLPVTLHSSLQGQRHSPLPLLCTECCTLMCRETTSA